ncbi:MAG: hypothetical protein OHK0041_23680 [Anaerolineales bacterium]
MDTDTLATLIVVGAIGFSLIFVDSILLASIFFTQRKANAAKNWPATVGTILESTLETRRSSTNSGWVQYPRIAYAYTVSGQSFTSSRISPGMEVGGTSAPGVIAKYPPGAQVKVYYHPQNPSDAVLEINTPASVMLLWIALVVINLMLCSAIPMFLFIF